jgi:hypothetical protein
MALTGPTITLAAPIAGDNTINAGEATAGFAVPGTTSGVEDGQIATVAIVRPRAPHRQSCAGESLSSLMTADPPPWRRHV